MRRWRGLGSALTVAVSVTLAAACSTAHTADTNAEHAAEPAGQLQAAAQEGAIPEDHLPRFTTDGELMRPETWEEWIMIGASIGLSYTQESFEPEPAADGGPGMFHNIYMQPWAYRHFRDTGEFPEGTMMILAMYSPSQSANPARGGWYPERPGFLAEIHLKQADLHESGWGFYGYGQDSQSAAMIPGDAACYSCHAQEADYDHVFVQFYPMILDRMAEHAPDSSY